MNYFSGCTDLKSARKVYIDLVKKHHPDKGGSGFVMREINTQFDLFKKHGKSFKIPDDFKKQRHKFSTDEYADAFTYSFNWGNVDFESMRQTFYKARGRQAGPKEAKFAKEYAGEWSEDFETEANKKAKQDAEDLKARKEKLADDVRRYKAEQERKAKEASDPVQQLLNKEYKRIAEAINNIINDIIRDKKYSYNMYEDSWIVIKPEDIKIILENK